MRKRIVIGAIILVALAAIIVATAVSSGQRGDEVEVLKVQKGDVSPTVTAEGLVTAKVTVNISSQVMGEIVRLPFKEGAAVKKGDVLVVINPDLYERDVNSSKANLDAAEVAARQAEVTLAQRKLDWERARDLFRDQVLSVQQHDDAKLALDQAALAVEQARTQVAQARAFHQKALDNLSKTTIRSPIDGIVTAVNAKEGETAIVGTMNFAGTIIVTVSDLSEIITEVPVDEVDFPRLKLGQPAVITVDALGGKQYAGKLTEIGASARAGQSGVQSNIRQFTVKVAITEPDSSLRPGITARVKLIADKRRDVVRVPIGAIRTEEKEGSQVFFVFTAEKGKVVKKIIQTGLSDDYYTEVLGGLDVGTQVITGPYRLLRTMHDGDRVKPKEIKAEDIQKKQKTGEEEE
ncbi:MAG: efflux RND transporter periplasmic adaptor subunit [Acidobacteriota bacterium]